MPKVSFTHSGVSLELPEGTRILEAALKAGVELRAECGGEGVCGKCLMRVTSGEVAGDAASGLPQALADQGAVLACRARLGETDVTVAPYKSERRGPGQFAEALENEAEDLRPVYPAVRLVELSVALPRLEDGLSDLDRFKSALQSAAPGRNIPVGLPILRELAASLREREGRVWAALDFSLDPPALLAVFPVLPEAGLCGLAVDLGTTSVAVSLVELESGRTLGTLSGFNRQIERGLDVISRINYAARPERLSELRELALATINSLAAALCAKLGLDKGHLVSAMLSGNTTMTHLVLGLPPEQIRLSPFTPTCREPGPLRAEEAGIEIAPCGLVRFAPCVGSYVGGDITAGLLCTELSSDTDEINFFLDIGTNGEMAAGNRDFLMACACSAGPAFEGGGIECGMPAASGAVERVDFEPGSLEPLCRVIGGAKPRGICGSGMLSLLAGLFRHGLLDRAGKLNREAGCARITAQAKRAAYQLAPGISISENDIENILRAKAAIYCAAELMLEKLGLSFEDIGKFYVAGGFGRFLNVEDSITLGLLPDIARDKYHFIGNSSLAGTRMALACLSKREKLAETASRVTYLELMTDSSYMDAYMAALFIPHTEAGKFPSVCFPKQA